jgi:putative two-component system response regulator
MSAKELETIRLGAALHDVGKIAVPDDVLKKPAKLTSEEFAIIRQHCYIGGQICKKIPFLAEVYPIVYHHHESFDGSGYPDGLHGEGIPLGARIVAVADAYDAMTSDRVYRKSLGQERAVEILTSEQGKQWDPRCGFSVSQIASSRQSGLATRDTR